jgi:sirohydrochlorin ferrochelatase
VLTDRNESQRRLQCLLLQNFVVNRMNDSNPILLPQNVTPDQLGLIVVDHGSRREVSNDALLQVVEGFAQDTDYAIVEPAHMELAAPTIADAFDRCVERGAKLVVVHPFFLLPGRHWDQDIPALVAAAAAKHEGVQWLVTAPLGTHPLMSRIMDDRIRHCLARVAGEAEECDVCAGTGRCQLHGENTST